MHPAAFSFAAEHLATYRLQDVAVLEIGSRNVNGSVRTLFENASRYFGIDMSKGDGVDKVIAAVDYDGRGKYDIAVSTEAMEHSPDQESIVRCAWRALRPGGLFVLTAAAPERPPHGCDGGAVQPGEHYRGIAPDELRAMLDDWADVEITHDPAAGDVYATARKSLAATE